MKKFLSLLLSALLAVSFVVSASAAENVVDDGVQESAVAAYDELMASFATTYSNSGEKIYPDYYGGSYINDAGQLIVYVTDNVQRPAVLSDNANVVYEPCTYSYNELLSVMDTLNNYKFSRSNDAIASNCLVFYIEIPARLWYNILHRRCAVGFEANCVQAGCLFFHPPVRVS